MAGQLSVSDCPKCGAHTLGIDTGEGICADCSLERSAEGLAAEIGRLEESYLRFLAHHYVISAIRAGTLTKEEENFFKNKGYGDISDLECPEFADCMLRLVRDRMPDSIERLLRADEQGVLSGKYLSLTVMLAAEHTPEYQARVPGEVLVYNLNKDDTKYVALVKPSSEALRRLPITAIASQIRRAQAIEAQKTASNTM